MAEMCFDDMAMEEWEADRRRHAVGEVFLPHATGTTMDGGDHAIGQPSLHIKGNPWGSAFENGPRIPLVWPKVVLVCAVICTVALVVLLLVRHLPLADVTRIRVSATNGSLAVPKQIATNLSQNATPWETLSIAKLEHQLENLALVSDAVVRRGRNGEILIQLEVVQPELVLAGITSNGIVGRLLMLRDGSVTPLNSEDWDIVSESVLTVQVPDVYATYVQAHGIDDRIEAWIELLGASHAIVGDNLPQVSRIVSATSGSGAFAGLVLHVDKLNAQLWIREPVDAERVKQALALIADEHERDDTRNIALRGQLRYDLYTDALVCRT